MKAIVSGESTNEEQNGDPWQASSSKQDASNDEKAAGFHDNFVATSDDRLPDSDEYIKSLERKLAKVQGKAKESSGKDMVKSIGKIREDIMSNLLSADSNRASGFDEEAEDIDSTSAIAFLERKLFPERQALNTEELQRLLEQDKLKAQLEESDSEVTSQKPADEKPQ